MRSTLILIGVFACFFEGCFITPDENRIDQMGTDTGCDPDGDIVEGMGDECTGDTDCKPGAPYCFTNPMDATQSGCTIQNCKEGECPACYKCCDCSSLVPTMIICLPEEQLINVPEQCACN